MGTGSSQNQHTTNTPAATSPTAFSQKAAAPATATPKADMLTDPSGTIVFDTSSGISLEEQKEILAGINSMTGGSRMVGEAPVTKAKKKGFLFPLFVNIGAVIILAAGLYLLSVIHVQDEQEIRSNTASFGLTERMLIREIRQGANPATDELMQLSGERDRASRIESLMSGFFTRVNNQIEEGRLNEASATLSEMKEFLDTPLFLSVRSLEAGRQNYLIAIDALGRSVSEAILLRETALGGTTIFTEALAELNARYAALEEENAALSARSSGIAEGIAEKEEQLRRFESANINQQETLNRRDTELVSLRNEKDENERKISDLNIRLAESIASREELQRQHNDLQARLDAAMRLFQPDN